MSRIKLFSMSRIKLLIINIIRRLRGKPIIQDIIALSDILTHFEETPPPAGMKPFALKESHKAYYQISLGFLDASGEIQGDVVYFVAKDLSIDLIDAFNQKDLIVFT